MQKGGAGVISSSADEKGVVEAQYEQLGGASRGGAEWRKGDDVARRRAPQRALMYGVSVGGGDDGQSTPSATPSQSLVNLVGIDGGMSDLPAMSSETVPYSSDVPSDESPKKAHLHEASDSIDGRSEGSQAENDSEKDDSVDWSDVGYRRC